MSEKMVPYVDFAKKIDSPAKRLRQPEISGVRTVAPAEDFKFKDLDLSISAFQEVIEQIRSGKSAVNPASLYDRTLSIRDISSNFDTRWTTQIFNEANATLVSAGRQLTFDEMNFHLFDYYSVISDMKFVSDTMSEVIEEINKNSEKEFPDVNELADALDSSVKGIMLKIKGFLGSVGEALGDAFQNLVKLLKEKGKWAVDKLKEAFKKAAEALDKLKLSMLESMFRFVGKVAELAKQNGWTVKEINVEMPDIGVKFEKLELGVVSIPFPIPMPQITPPKVSMKFGP